MWVLDGDDVVRQDKYDLHTLLRSGSVVTVRATPTPTKWLAGKVKE